MTTMRPSRSRSQSRQLWSSSSSKATSSLFFPHHHSLVVVLLVLLIQLEQLPLVSGFWNHYMKFSLPPSRNEIQFMQHDLTSHGTIDLGLLFFKTGDGSDVTNKTVSSFIDVVQFQVSHTCSNENYGCGKEWSNLGIGTIWNRTDVDGNEQEIVQWCCSVEAVQNGICQPTNHGRLIVHKDLASKNKIFHRSLEIPNQGRFQKRLTDATLKNRSKGSYVVVMSNCESRGRNITVIGPVKWINEDDDHIDNVAIGTHDENGTTKPKTPDIHKIRNKKSSWIFPTFAVLTILGLFGLLIREKRNNTIRQPGENNRNGIGGVSSEAPPMSMALLMMGMSYLFLNKQQPNQHKYPHNNGEEDDEMMIPNIVTDDDDDDVYGNKNTNNVYYSDHPQQQQDDHRELEIPTIVSRNDNDNAITTERNIHSNKNKVVRIAMTGPVTEDINDYDDDDDIVIVGDDGAGDMLVDVNVDIGGGGNDTKAHTGHRQQFDADSSDDDMPIFA